MNQIIVRYLGDNEKADRWQLVQSIEVEVAPGRQVLIPAGYVTDFASVPPWLWSLIPPIGRYNLACVVHDYLYDHRLFEGELGERAARLLADRTLLRLANEADPRGRWRHVLMYRFCRWFGRGAWRR